MKKTLLITSIVLMALLSACTRQVGWVGLDYLNTIDASYQLFNGRKMERIPVDAGKTFDLIYDVEVNEGALHIDLLDPDRNLVWEASFLEDSKDAMSFRAEMSGRYTLRITGDQTKGGFELRWDSND